MGTKPNQQQQGSPASPGGSRMGGRPRQSSQTAPASTGPSVATGMTKVDGDGVRERGGTGERGGSGAWGGGMARRKGRGRTLGRRGGLNGAGGGSDGRQHDGHRRVHARGRQREEDDELRMGWAARCSAMLGLTGKWPFPFSVFSSVFLFII
jgi:hypothetical protein